MSVGARKKNQHNPAPGRCVCFFVAPFRSRREILGTSDAGEQKRTATKKNTLAQKSCIRVDGWGVEFLDKYKDLLIRFKGCARGEGFVSLFFSSCFHDIA